MSCPDTFSGFSQTSKVRSFLTIANGKNSLSIVAKHSNLDVSGSIRYSHMPNCRGCIISRGVVLQDKYNKREGS